MERYDEVFSRPSKESVKKLASENNGVSYNSGFEGYDLKSCSMSELLQARVGDAIKFPQSSCFDKGIINLRSDGIDFYSVNNGKSTNILDSLHIKNFSHPELFKTPDIPTSCSLNVKEFEKAFESHIADNGKAINLTYDDVITFAAVGGREFYEKYGSKLVDAAEAMRDDEANKANKYLSDNPDLTPSEQGSVTGHVFNYDRMLACVKLMDDRLAERESTM